MNGTIYISFSIHSVNDLNTLVNNTDADAKNHKTVETYRPTIELVVS